MNFPPIFTHWIMACLSSVKFTIALNGQQGNMFPGQRSLKQGDPLSPLLFVLTMEYLSRLFKKASSLLEFKYHHHCKKLRLTHLMFADDLIIFCKAHPKSLKILMEAFKEFTKCSGLKANLTKSQIVFGGDCHQVHHDCLRIIGFTEGQLPLKYLGIPITSSRLTKIECRTLVEKISLSSLSLQHRDTRAPLLFM